MLLFAIGPPAPACTGADAKPCTVQAVHAIPAQRARVHTPNHALCKQCMPSQPSAHRCTRQAMHCLHSAWHPSPAHLALKWAVANAGSSLASWCQRPARARRRFSISSGLALMGCGARSTQKREGRRLHERHDECRAFLGTGRPLLHRASSQQMPVFEALSCRQCVRFMQPGPRVQTHGILKPLTSLSQEIKLNNKSPAFNEQASCHTS